SAMTAVARMSPDAVLLAGDLPRLSVAAFVAQVRKRWPNVTVVAFGEPHAPGATPLERSAPTGKVLEALAAPPEAAGPAVAAPDGVALLRQLTQRERIVLMKLAAGVDPEEIARALGVK